MNAIAYLHASSKDIGLCVLCALCIPADVAGVLLLSQIPGLVNVDFADVRTVMTNAGTSLMGQGRASGKGRAKEAALQVCENACDKGMPQTALPLHQIVVADTLHFQSRLPPCCGQHPASPQVASACRSLCTLRVKSIPDNLQAISSPLLDVGIQRATGIVWNITGPPDLTLFEVGRQTAQHPSNPADYFSLGPLCTTPRPDCQLSVLPHQVNEAAEQIYDLVDATANLIFGAVVDPNMPNGEVGAHRFEILPCVGIWHVECVKCRFWTCHRALCCPARHQASKRF